MMRARLGLRLAIAGAVVGLIAGAGAAGAENVVETPPIDITVTPLDREVVIEWQNPSLSVISNLVVEDSSWGGTATLKVLGDYSGHCDMDMSFRTTNSVDTFTDPFVDRILTQTADPDRPNYWIGTAVPYAGGAPDVCENHNIQLVALDSDTLTAEGTASGGGVRFFWIDVPVTDTLTLPADYRAGIDSIPVSNGVLVGFGPGNVNAGDKLTIRVRSNDVQLAWDYVLHGGTETDRVSSSDPAETEITICRPGEVVPFRFGLSLTIDVDTVFTETTVYDTTYEIDPESGETLSVDIDTSAVTESEIVGSVPSGGDSLGVMQVLYRKIDGYRVYRGDITNPDRFVLLRELSFCDDDQLQTLLASPVRYVDREGVHNGFPYTYFVTAFDTLTGGESEARATDRVFPRTDATEDLSRILVVPNPYKRNVAWEEDSEKVQFTHLPKRATIRVYTVGGDLVREWEHDDPSGGGNSDWNTRNAGGDLVVSGVYVYYVKSPAGGERVGKFIIVR
ncbi:MAG: hypothetical protein ABIK65_03345 [Candidatus Eisenbacteria bacterium]